MSQYHVYDRQARAPQGEVQPQALAKAVASIYSHQEFADRLKLNQFFKWATSVCGRLYNTVLTTPDEKRRKIQEDFVDKYDIDMSIYNRTSYLQYRTVNDWFSRELSADPGVRPLASPGDDAVVSSGADCRAIAFARVPPDQRV